MSASPLSGESPGPGTRAEMMSALFAHLVMQQTNMTLMLLGKVPHPETGETLREIESARLLIDQLEMIEFKTRGNLDSQEEKLLKQSLTAVRMAFVDAVDHPVDNTEAAPAGEAAKPSGATAAPGPDSTPSGAAEEPRKKFSKNYGSSEG